MPLHLPKYNSAINMVNGMYKNTAHKTTWNSMLVEYILVSVCFISAGLKVNSWCITPALEM